MAYSELVYQLAGEDREVEVIGETMIASQSYFIAQDDHSDLGYSVYLLNEDEELELLEEEDLSDLILHNWKEEAYGLSENYLWNEEEEEEEVTYQANGFDSVEESFPLMSESIEEDVANR